MGNAYITINEDTDGHPIEVFVGVGKAGSDIAAMAEALGRVISTSLRFRSVVDAKQRAFEMAQQLAGIGGRRSVGFGPTKILSLPDAVAAAFSMHYKFNVNGFGRVTLSPAGDISADGSDKPENSNHLANGHSSVKTKADIEQAVNVLNKINDNPEGQTYMFSDSQKTHTTGTDICPSCGASSLVYQEGCAKCFSCGHSEC